MCDETGSPYSITESELRYVVLDDQQNEIMVCGDSRSAEHYCTLLTKAFQRGYRKGYRDARSTQA